ncbi:MAG: hypothetical protein GYA66_08915, partial [Phyllobacteriaceae bacterium]|nr:hypothetical protein [Phyllobacteriaceae bacterium]
MPRIVLALMLFLSLFCPVMAQSGDLQALLEQNRAAVEKPSRATAEILIKTLLQSDATGVHAFLEK